LTFQCTGSSTVAAVEVELLTVPGCANRTIALTRVRAALERVGAVEVIVAERVIANASEAAAAGMHGSPTVLVDGRDPFAAGGTEASLSCRLYRTPAGLEGASSVDALASALSRPPGAGGVSRPGDGCCDAVPPSRPEDFDAVRRLGVRGFAVDSGDPAIGLAAVATLRVLVEDLEVLHVSNAREHGWSWQAIAERLGITRQSVHKKHRGDRPRRRG
jgi:hypothetical protein